MNTYSKQIVQNHSTRFSSLIRTTCLIALGVLASLGTQAHAEASQQAVDRANAFLNAPSRNQEIIDCMHFGEQYQSKEAGGCEAVAGGFGITYKYLWSDDGWTSVQFTFDDNGSLTGLNVIDSNGVVQAPFLVANGTIQLVGQAVVEAEKGQITESRRQLLQKFVDEADARGLLVTELEIDQAMGS